MSKHDPEHEELLLAVVAGDVPPNAPEVRERTSECATCAARLARLRSVTQRLDEEAQEELAILALAERMDDAPGTERIEAFREHPEYRRYGVDPARRPGGRPVLPWAAAIVGLAAAALLVVVFARGGENPGGDGGGDGGDPPGTEERYLGDDLIRIEGLESFDDDLELHFRTPAGILENVARWQVVVEGVTAEGGDFYERYDAERSPWSDPASVREFPDEVTIVVNAIDATGRVIRRGEPVTVTRRR